MDILERIERLSAIGVALSAEQDIQRLLEMILVDAQDLTDADAGSLYTVNEEGRLKFEIIRTDSLGFAMGGASGVPIPFDPIPLYDKQGEPNTKMVVAYAALKGETINIPDAYTAEGFDFSGTRAFDAKTGYRSKSFLTVPMRNHEGEIIGVFQLINRRAETPGDIVPFSPEDQRLAASLASQAAVVLTKNRLLESLSHLLDSLVKMIATAIDEKSPYTGNHCRRVPVLTIMLAEAASRIQNGPLQAFRLDEEGRCELEMAAWLHDCGKLTTPQHVIDKATKLETVFDRINLVDARFEILKRDAEIEVLRRKIQSLEKGEAGGDSYLEKERETRLVELEEDRAFLFGCNKGGEFLSSADQERIRTIARRHSWKNARGEMVPLLTDEEVENLLVARGTLTEEEKEILHRHVKTTIKMLETLPFPKHLKNVPEYAGGHHERMDGTGYPRRLTGEELPMPARIMAIADIFEALTAKDRPYKKGKALSEVLAIMGRMKLENHIDPDLFDIFVREKVYLKFARQFLDPDQIDHVNHATIPGYSERGAVGGG